VVTQGVVLGPGLLSLSYLIYKMGIKQPVFHRAFNAKCLLDFVVFCHYLHHAILKAKRHHREMLKRWRLEFNWKEEAHTFVS
jgi:hypothetical protein